MLQNLVCFSGPSQGLPPNWGGLQVRVRSRKPRPHVLEQRLQGDHSSQAPCTARGQEGVAAGATPARPAGPHPRRCPAHLDTRPSCCTAAAPAGVHCTACCKRTTRRNACASASPRRTCWSTHSTETTPRPPGHLGVQRQRVGPHAPRPGRPARLPTAAPPPRSQKPAMLTGLGRREPEVLQLVPQLLPPSGVGGPQGLAPGAAASSGCRTRLGQRRLRQSPHFSHRHIPDPGTPSPGKSTKKRRGSPQNDSLIIT